MMVAPNEHSFGYDIVYCAELRRMSKLSMVRQLSLMQRDIGENLRLVTKAVIDERVQFNNRREEFILDEDR